ncbi:MAG: DNA repair protein RecO, partial [Gammaproteobacteria bacterium]
MKTSLKNEMQAAYVLHTRAYQETSLLVELLTLQGRISVIAKGAKRPKSSFRGILQPFIPLLINCVGRNELKTLTYAEASEQHVLLQGEYLFAGLYVNELLMRLLLKESPCDFLFHAYENILQDLRNQKDLWVCLRLFEKTLLQALGYELNLSHDVNTGEVIEPDAHYIYLLEKGPVRVDEVSAEGYVFSGKSLLDLAQDNLQDRASCKQVKQ